MTKRILVVAAHPDDEALGMGGTWFKYKQQGCEMGVVWLTDGIGSRGPDNGQIDIRRQGVKESLDVLKPSYSRHGSFPDNQLDVAPRLNIIQFIEEAINEFMPDTLFIHSEKDLNIDHKIAHIAAITAARPLSGCSVKDIYAFEVLSSTEWGGQMFRPNMYVDITTVKREKLELLNCYDSELREPPHPRSLPSVESKEVVRGSESGFFYSEAFEVIRTLIS